jgi:hypothetical protein
VRCSACQSTTATGQEQWRSLHNAVSNDRYLSGMDAEMSWAGVRRLAVIGREVPGVINYMSADPGPMRSAHIPDWRIIQDGTANDHGGQLQFPKADVRNSQPNRIPSF